MLGTRSITLGPTLGPTFGARSSGTTPISGVTRDAASGWYFPNTSAEWTTFMAAAGLATGNPGSLNRCQEASGSLADSIDSVNLAQSGAGHLYAQAVTGFTRLAATTVDATVGQKWVNTAAAPNASLTSVLYLVAIRMPASNPAAARDLFASQALLDCRISTASKMTIINAASTTGTQVLSGTVQWLALQHDITNSVFVGHNLLERVVGTFGATASNTTFAIGGQQATAADVGYLYSAVFSGAAAELTQTQMRTLFQTLTRDAVVPVVIPW